MKTWNDSKQLAKSKDLGNMFKKSDKFLVKTTIAKNSVCQIKFELLT